MIDVKKPLRTAYYSLLHNAITVNAVTIPVGSDLKKLVDSAAPLYILINGASGNDNSTMSTFDSQEQIIIEIVCRNKTRPEIENVDNVASQIMNLVMPVAGYNALPGQIGVAFNCVQLINDRYLELILNPGNTVYRRLLTFTQKVRQTNNAASPPLSPSGGFAQIVNEIPTGVINGVNKVFTTANKFIASSVEVSLNGLRQVPGLHFTITLPNIITFVDAPLVDGTNGPDVILIDYISTP